VTEQRIEEPNAAELQWIAGYVDLATQLAETEALPTIDELDRLWARWLNGSPQPEEANDVVHAVGLAFGQRLVDDLGMRWAVVTDEYGTEMAAYEPLGDTLVFPANLVAKRWESKQTDFLRPISDEVAARLIALRAG
jgi:Domain of unknown function (DUF3806)